MNFVERIQKEVMVIDGSMGVFLQSEGLPSGYAPDLWNSERPDVIASVHKHYAKAGSQIVISNSFGATRPRLADYGRESEVKEINRAAVENARKGGGDNILVAGGSGPTGKLVAPLGDLAFEEAVDIFREQFSALVEAGADVLIIETMFDLMEMKAAIIGANEVRKNVPLIACMTYTADAVTDTGATPEAVAAVMEGLSVDVIGVNCSTGPEEMLDVVRRLGEATHLPICVEPNAGLPVMVKGETIYKASADDMAKLAPKFVEYGANIIGGCCGTRPEYIEKVCHLVKGAKPVARTKKEGVLISSRSEIIRIGSGFPFVKIGEKINPTGKKKFGAAIKEGRTDRIVMEARKQMEAGASALDVNVGVPMTDESAMMEKAVTAIQNVTQLPLVIDSSGNDAIYAGLRFYSGRALLNSVNAEESKLEEVLPMAKRMGAAVIALCAGEDVPESAEKRFDYAKRIYDRALSLGLTKDDIVFDCLAVVVSAMQEGARQTLLTIRRIKDELGCATILGLSNTSFGLPDRATINNSFLAMAMAEGLDAAIVNPYDAGMHKAAAGASLFTRRDDGCKRYIDFATATEVIKESSGKEKEAAAQKAAMPIADKIRQAVIEGDKDVIQELIQKGMDSGLKPMEIFLELMTPAVRVVGDLFAQRKKFIPHLIASADAMKKGMVLLDPLLREARGGEEKGTIIFATVKGDVHDIGKNVCIIMLENFGFNVIDLGRNVSTEEILDRAQKESADIIGLSALMTTTMMRMKDVVDKVRSKKLPYKVMIGGAAVTNGFAKEIGADGYGKDVGTVVDLAESLLNGK